MSCPVMHNSADDTGLGGGCPVMHGGLAAAPPPPCHREMTAFNACQTKEVVRDKTKEHCYEQAQALRECELGRRRRAKRTDAFAECCKGGGDPLTCLKKAEE